MKIEKGKIVKALSGFYYVDIGNEVITCRAKGSFRHQKITPLVGDDVEIECEGSVGTVSKIFERKNFLSRPMVSNIDNLLLVCSTTSPVPSTRVIDTMTVLALMHNITPCIVITKGDLKSADELFEIYKKTPFEVFCICDNDESDLIRLKAFLEKKSVALCGNSGVGKSTLLNRLDSSLCLKTAEISEKLNRGKHTTRETSLLKIGQSFLIDTPGFSSVELFDCKKSQLQFFFPEFSDFLSDCKFSTCSHRSEKGCAILKKVDDGTISKSRHENYVELYSLCK